MKQNGFTLIELLVVISIIGLLASVVLVSLNNARHKARYTKAVGDMAQIGKAVEQYNVASVTGYPVDVGTNVLPSELASYLSRWPTPACAGWSYDWENWVVGANVYVRLTLRRADSSPVYFYCYYSNAADCGAGYGGGTNILNLPTKQITCGE